MNDEDPKYDDPDEQFAWEWFRAGYEAMHEASSFHDDPLGDLGEKAAAADFEERWPPDGARRREAPEPRIGDWPRTRLNERHDPIEMFVPDDDHVSWTGPDDHADDLSDALVLAAMPYRVASAGEPDAAPDRPTGFGPTGPGGALSIEKMLDAARAADFAATCVPSRPLGRVRDWEADLRHWPPWDEL